MSSATTLNIPQQLYQRVQYAAQRQQRNVYDVAQELLEHGLSQLESYPVHSGKEQEKRAFSRLHATLLNQYAGEYAAIYGGKLVDHGVDQAALLARIDEQYPDQFVLIRPLRPEPEIVYEHRSMRWG